MELNDLMRTCAGRLHRVMVRAVPQALWRSVLHQNGVGADEQRWLFVGMHAIRGHFLLERGPVLGADQLSSNGEEGRMTCCSGVVRACLPARPLSDPLEAPIIPIATQPTSNENSGTPGVLEASQKQTGLAGTARTFATRI